MSWFGRPDGAIGRAVQAAGICSVRLSAFGSVCVFFLSFFVQIHAVAVIGATNAFDDEFGHMMLQHVEWVVSVVLAWCWQSGSVEFLRCSLAI